MNGDDGDSGDGGDAYKSKRLREQKTRTIHLQNDAWTRNVASV
jgi:hypothetical protein